MPGTWLAGEDLTSDGEPVAPYAGCGCSQPCIWDGRRLVWRHLKDGTACTPRSQGAQR
jgi:hypothetical protein